MTQIQFNLSAPSVEMSENNLVTTKCSSNTLAIDFCQFATLLADIYFRFAFAQIRIRPESLLHQFFRCLRLFEQAVLMLVFGLKIPIQFICQLRRFQVGLLETLLMLKSKLLFFRAASLTMHGKCVLSWRRLFFI